MLGAADDKPIGVGSRIQDGIGPAAGAPPRRTDTVPPMSDAHEGAHAYDAAAKVFGQTHAPPP